MTTFRPMNITTDAADMARLYSYIVPEPITVDDAPWEYLKQLIREASRFDPHTLQA